ncbi:MAG: hypothetical protein ACR2ML_06240 [Solirubrobacteraceae bacterium]
MQEPSVQQRSVVASRALFAAAVAGVGLIPAMFLGWFGASGLARTKNLAGPDLNAWEVFTKLDVILAMTAVLGAGLALGIGVMARRRAVPGWPMLGGAAVGAIGTTGAALLLGRMINAPGDDALQSVLFGSYLGLALTVALAAAGWVAAVVGLNALRRGYVISMAPIVGGKSGARTLGAGPSASSGPTAPSPPRVPGGDPVGRR